MNWPTPTDYIDLSGNVINSSARVCTQWVLGIQPSAVKPTEKYRWALKTATDRRLLNGFRRMWVTGKVKNGRKNTFGSTECMSCVTPAVVVYNQALESTHARMHARERLLSLCTHTLTHTHTYHNNVLC